MVVLLSSLHALAGGFEIETRYTSSHGPDAYGLVRLMARGGPDLHFGAVSIGGTQPAAVGFAGRTVALAPGLELLGELQLGVLRETGASGGGRAQLRLEASPVTAVLGLGGLWGLGVQAEAGVDAPLSGAWQLEPRLYLETWAGRRDPAIRAELGFLRTGSEGWYVGAAASGGGRDVLHMGPGAMLTLGRSL